MGRKEWRWKSGAGREQRDWRSGIRRFIFDVGPTRNPPIFKLGWSITSM